MTDHNLLEALGEFPYIIDDIQFTPGGVAITYTDPVDAQNPVATMHHTLIVRPDHPEFGPLIQQLLDTGCDLINRGVQATRQVPDTVPGSRRRI